MEQIGYERSFIFWILGHKFLLRLNIYSRFNYDATSYNFVFNSNFFHPEDLEFIDYPARILYYCKPLVIRG